MYKRKVGSKGNELEPHLPHLIHYARETHQPFASSIVLDALRLFFTSGEFGAVEVNMEDLWPSAAIVGEHPYIVQSARLTIDGHRGYWQAVGIRF